MINPELARLDSLTREQEIWSLRLEIEMVNQRMASPDYGGGADRYHESLVALLDELLSEEPSE